MKYKEIKKTISSTIQKLYPEVPVYGIETTKGYEKPCFFVSTTTHLIDGNHAFKRKGCYIEILMMQDEPNEAQALAFFETIEKAFYPQLVVGDRSLTTDDFSTEFIGDDENIPSIEFHTEFYEEVEKPAEKAELLRKLRIKEELR